MWYNTPITSLLGIQYPILQGPMGGGFSSSKLLAAVSNAGGLGGYGAYTMQPDEIRALAAEIRQLTDKPYNLNLWVSDVDDSLKGYTPEQFQKARAYFKPYFDELGIALPEPDIYIASKFERQVEAMLEIRPAVFSFVFGIPDDTILKECRRLNIKTVGAATTIDEARMLEDAGVEAIVAAGFEAGGHRPSFLRPAKDSLTGTFTLVQQLRRAVRTPIIAAGGIANGRGVAASLMLGADAAQIGTAFMACDESSASQLHRDRIFSPAAKYTTLTNAFTGRLGRGMTNRLSDEFHGLPEDVAPFPLQGRFIAPLRAAAMEQGRADMILFWAGQIATEVKHRKVEALMEELVRETGELLAR
ncbi:nitronate monooxygenase [Chitinophaga horti]|uniref:Propionate 3-nitronate monooxygenase n=1 Tax=Chitinophaga horti TaxID=2920382 RepID=A0ABY6J7R2_9BACT|nr:nitronate monooxygenase [Chitinophaga horti]UYQ95637.1 nitronate monooxygenase [Chitinophaga horti]